MAEDKKKEIKMDELESVRSVMRMQICKMIMHNTDI